MTNTDIIANKFNMERFPGNVAYSYDTQEEYSGNAGDYFLVHPMDPLLDDNGNPMFLVSFKTVVVPAGNV